jgi:hypothetical protein
MDNRIIIEAAELNSIKIVKRLVACEYGVLVAFPEPFWDDLEQDYPTVSYHTEGVPAKKIPKQYITVESPRRYIFLSPSFFHNLEQTETGVHVIEFFGRTKSYRCILQWDVALKEAVNTSATTIVYRGTSIELNTVPPVAQVDGDVWLQDLSGEV